jgi:UDP-N-acetyl-D-mannosaminuronate dehydrogenase
MAAHKRKLAVVGLGYVGLPVAAAFARTGAPVIGFDVDADRIAQLRNGIDPTGELSEADLASANLRFSSKAADLAVADFYIIAVPTPIDVARRPDLSALLQASEMVGRTLARRHCRVRIDRLPRRHRRRLHSSAGADHRSSRWPRFRRRLFPRAHQCRRP